MNKRLEILRTLRDYFSERADAEYFTDSPSPVANEEMKMLALIEELEAPASGEVEPVAWTLKWPESNSVNAPTTFRTEDLAKRYAEGCQDMGIRVVPLFTHPPASQVPENVLKALRIAMHHWMKDGVHSEDEEDATFCDGVLQEILTTPGNADTGEAIEPDQFWDADNSETNYDSMYELADNAAQDLRKGETMVVDVLCAKRLPTRQMKIWVKDDDEIDFEWTWPPTAQGGEGDE